MAETSAGQIDYRGLVDGHRVHTSLYHEPRVFAEELRKVWYRTWVYVGHASEVAEPGDYVAKRLGLEPLIMTRGEDGEVRLLLNRCAHRGNTVCEHERGNAFVFRCSYHGWTYDNHGRLLGVPFKSAYDSLDRRERSLPRVPRVATYRGFVFGSMAADGPTLEEHLGNARPLLDRFVELSPTGRLDLNAGTSKTRIRANWKMWLENATDNYHVSVVHRSALVVQGREAQRRSIAQSQDGSLALARDLGGGHGQLDFAPQHRVTGQVFAGSVTDGASSDETAAAEYEAALVKSYGAERAAELLSPDGPPHFAIFPNLFIRAPQEVRVIHPISAGLSFQYEYPALLDGVPALLNSDRLARHQNAYGAAGFFMTDDIDLWERNQRAIANEVDGWMSLDRGLHREQAEEGGMRSGHITDEVAQRGMWQHYLTLMGA